MRIEKIAKARPSAILLREKDLSEEAYFELAREVMQICKEYDTPCILHRFFQGAEALGADAIHLPLGVLTENFARVRNSFRILGASCHSLDEAKLCERFGASYVTAGHIFETGCKMGLPGRGLGFLRDVIAAVKIPVFAIGGIGAENVQSVKAAGARGVCVMSGAMTCENALEYINKLKEI